MDPNIKDIFQVTTWSGATIGGLVAAFRAIIEMRHNREQRQKELRWRKSKEAKIILDELFGNSYSRDAMKMLDWSGREYEIKEGIKKTISVNDVLKGLRVNNLEFSDKEAFIRDCFDQFFDKLEYIQHLVTTELIDFRDISGPIEYYVDLMAKNKKAFCDFLDFYGYSDALLLFENFEQWKKPNKRLHEDRS